MLSESCTTGRSRSPALRDAVQRHTVRASLSVTLASKYNSSYRKRHQIFQHFAISLKRCPTATNQEGRSSAVMIRLNLAISNFFFILVEKRQRCLFNGRFCADVKEGFGLVRPHQNRGRCNIVFEDNFMPSTSTRCIPSVSCIIWRITFPFRSQGQWTLRFIR